MAYRHAFRPSHACLQQGPDIGYLEEASEETSGDDMELDSLQRTPSPPQAPLPHGHDHGHVPLGSPIMPFVQPNLAAVGQEVAHGLPEMV